MVQEDGTVVEKCVLRVLPGDQQPLDHEVNDGPRDERESLAHHGRQRAAGGKELRERFAWRRDEPQFRAVGNRHVEQSCTSLLSQAMTIARRVDVDTLDGGEFLAFVAADHFGRVGVVAGS